MRTPLTLWVCLFVIASNLFAQFETSSVLGTVKDTSDAVLAGARVTLTNLGTNISVTRDTDENGSYEFVNVKPGRYKVSAEKQGFSISVADNFIVNVAA